jgi:hypothetical protein
MNWLYYTGRWERQINVVKLYREKVHVVIFEDQDAIEPEEASNPENPTDENAQILSLSWNNICMFIKYADQHCNKCEIRYMRSGLLVL